MFFKYFYWMFLLAVFLLLIVWQQTESVRMGYKIEGIRKECDSWDTKNGDLRFKVNRLLSMERLDEVAVKKSLVRPKEENIIYLK